MDYCLISVPFLFNAPPCSGPINLAVRGVLWAPEAEIWSSEDNFLMIFTRNYWLNLVKQEKNEGTCPTNNVYANRQIWHSHPPAFVSVPGKQLSSLSSFTDDCSPDTVQYDVAELSIEFHNIINELRTLWFQQLPAHTDISSSCHTWQFTIVIIYIYITLISSPPSLIHFWLKTCLYHKSYPPSKFSSSTGIILPDYLSIWRFTLQIKFLF